MLRIIVRGSDNGAAIHVGGPVVIDYKTFDVELPKVEAYLTEFTGVQDSYTSREIVGVEVMCLCSVD